MNDKIKQLVAYAGIRLEFCPDSQGWEAQVDDDDLEAFALLIVGRVISVYNDTDTFKTSTYDDQRVLKYFGVEE